ncbi:hypothetical protein DFH09DRAFT_1313098 [Mycena vulgaris]|nr:hypothetical protein DFH09DRAFT_1341746 [Mycena vulgaris]KAJ6570498.1 hypothetical protein DFH09DRAFT_1313098 [Mycena vulgaris]
MAIALIAVIAVFWCYRRLQRRVTAAHAKGVTNHTISPFSPLEPEAGTLPQSEHKVPESSGAHNSSGSTQSLKNELRAVQEKMVDIADLERRASATIAPISGSSQLLRLISTRSSSRRANSVDEDLPSQLAAARERNEALAARIRELETQMHSEWALGLSDEPPPGYTA